MSKSYFIIGVALVICVFFRFYFYAENLLAKSARMRCEVLTND